MGFSTIPAIFLLICTFWIWATNKARSNNYITRIQVASVYSWLVLLAVWGIASSLFALSGKYSSPEFYTSFPALWVPLTPVFISSIFLLVCPTFKNALWMITANTSPRAFMFIHALRVAAIGGIFKAYHGLLPVSFVYPIGIPDFIFGIVSFFMAIRHGKKGYSSQTLIAWNVLGIMVLMAAPILMQLGLPSPVYLLNSQPDARKLFEFPMVLAPTLVVTTLLFMNGWCAFVLWRSNKNNKII